MKAVTIQECCHICEYYYNRENCPLYRTYNAAADMGEENLEESAKYRVSCDNFMLNKNLIKGESIMTQEQKAKRYDELIAKLIKAKEDDMLNDERYCCVIDEIVPELAESNDEKIRKELLEIFKENKGPIYLSLTLREKSFLISLLEKQDASDETKAKMFLINKGYPIDANGVFPTYEDMYSIIKDGLEKHNEIVDINPSEFDLHLNMLLKQFETLPKEELASSLGFYLNVVQNDGTYKADEKQSEQKPSDKSGPKFKKD